MATSHETDVLYSFVYTEIPIDVPWLENSVWPSEYGYDTVIPFDALLNAQTSDFDYDLEVWDLNIVAISRQSTDDSAEGSADF